MYSKHLISVLGVSLFALLGIGSSSNDSTSSSNDTPTAAESKESPEQRAVEEAAATARRAAEDAACKQDLQCWGDKKSLGAGIRCEEPIERLAKYAHEWTDGVLEPKMSHFRWKNKAAGIVTFSGDKLRMQNGFGAWQNVIYECDYDGETVFDVRVRPGRL